MWVVRHKGQILTMDECPDDPSGMRAYHRVSQVDQNERLAVDELRLAAAARGMNIVAEITEIGSGANNDRPGLLKILAAARRSELDAVLCWKLDRWGHSSLDLLANLRALEDAGVRFSRLPSVSTSSLAATPCRTCW